MGPESVLFIWLVLKHFVCDYLLQSDYIAQNKHSFKSLAGYLHAAMNMAGTAFVISLLYSIGVISGGTLMFPIFLLIEFVSHFLIDLGKMKLGKKYKPDPSQRIYWQMIGADQALHLTLLAIIAGVLA